MNTVARPFDWNHVRAFLATAEEGSLSAAARYLGLTQPTLGRQVAALEEELGVMLFERIGRSLILTRAGIELLEHTRAMGAAANRIALVAEGQAQTIEGLVRITASDIFSAYILPTFLHQLRRRAPGIEIDVVAANDIRDLMRREADIAIRHVRPEQPDLIARLVGESSAHFYASVEYLDQRGRPKSLADLAQHDFISFGDINEMMKHYAPLGLPLRPKNFPIGSKSGLVAWEFARRGFGIIAMSDDLAQATPGMELVRLEIAPISFPIWLVTHRELHTSRRIRLVFDMLADYLTHEQ